MTHHNAFHAYTTTSLAWPRLFMKAVAKSFGSHHSLASSRMLKKAVQQGRSERRSEAYASVR